jgi:tRNA U34 5-methylaminomethyl-2-thiouridine-forming methyltransferase MnmC
MAVEQIITADGSPTLFLPEINEHYHSVNGAVQESQHVYIEAGFNQCAKNHIQVLELGLGTGLNVLLTAMEAERRGVQVVYTALEKYPLSGEIVGNLHYFAEKSEWFQQIHAMEWEKPCVLTSFFTLQKIRTDFRDFSYSGKYDVVYYDAFAPDKQPEVWSQEILDALFKAMHPAGILTTYCAKGQIRRMMQRSGFSVERIPGPPGKREMLRGFATSS